MSKITSIILPQNYEFVRDRIADILYDEIHGQAVLTGEYEDYDIEVAVERSVPLDGTDLVFVNISMDEGNWGNKHQGSSAGTYVFNIDTTVLKKNKENLPADRESVLASQRVAGICRAILENSIYKTLGFAPPFISRTMCSGIKFGKPNGTDAQNVSVSRLVFTVVVNETTPGIVPNLIEGYETEVKINETNKGYLFEGENY